MSAIISSDVQMKEILKATGFDCPQGMENKTFEQATSGGGGGGSGITVEPITITQNGTTVAPSGKAYSPITVNVPSGSGGGRTKQPLSITSNGNYNTPDGVYYDPITVNVPSSAVDITMTGVKTGSLTTAGTPVTLTDSYGTSSDNKYIVWAGKEQINTRDLAVGQTYNYTIPYNNLTFDLTLKKTPESGGAEYRITAEFKDRGSVFVPLNCFLVMGTLN